MRAFEERARGLIAYRACAIFKYLISAFYSLVPGKRRSPDCAAPACSRCSPSARAPMMTYKRGKVYGYIPVYYRPCPVSSNQANVLIIRSRPFNEGTNKRPPRLDGELRLWMRRRRRRRLTLARCVIPRRVVYDPPLFGARSAQHPFGGRERRETRVWVWDVHRA